MCDRGCPGFGRPHPPREERSAPTRDWSAYRCVRRHPHVCILREKARCPPAPRRIVRQQAGRVAGLLGRSAEYPSRCLSLPREIPSPHAGPIAFAQPWNARSSSFEWKNDCRCESGQRTPLDDRHCPGPSSTTPGRGRRAARSVAGPQVADEVPQRVVPCPLFVSEWWVIVPCIVMLAECNPALRRETQRVFRRVRREREFPRGSEVLAFVELNDEPGVGNPEVAGCQKVGFHKVADAESPMRLQRRGDVAQRRFDLGSSVYGEASSPARSVVGQAGSVEALQQLAHPDLAFRASLGMTSR